MSARVQLIHNTDVNTPSEITMFVHCGRCLDEWKKEKSKVTPAQYARTQTGWTAKGFQVWCVRHDCNITNVEIALPQSARSGAK